MAKKSNKSPSPNAPGPTTASAPAVPSLPLDFHQLGESEGDETPSADWSVEKLEKYTMRELRRFADLGRKTAVAVYRAGHALTLIHDVKLKAKGAWMQWLADQNISYMTAKRAMKFYKDARHEERIEKLTHADACRLLVEQQPVEDATQPKPKKARVMEAKELLYSLDSVLNAWCSAPEQANSEDLDAMEWRLQQALYALRAIKNSREQSATVSDQH